MKISKSQIGLEKLPYQDSRLCDASKDPKWGITVQKEKKIGLSKYLRLRSSNTDQRL